MKRSALSGTTPTINTASTIDNTWLPTDIQIGELFANVEDDRVFVRTNNGLFEFNVGPTGTTVFDFCQTGIILSSISGCSPGSSVTIFDQTTEIANFALSGTSINADRFVINTGLTNSVIVGGEGITMDQSNTAFVPSLKILTADTTVLESDFSLFINSANTVVKEARNLLGTEYFYEEDDTLSTTVSSTPVSKLILTANTLGGDYRYMSSCEIANSNITGSIEVTTQINGVDVNVITKEPKDVTDFIPSAGFKKLTLSAGTQTVEILFAALAPGTASIRRARLELMRIL